MTSMVRIGSAAESNDGSLFTSTETLGSIGRLEDAFEKFVRSHFTGREGGMTTVWRPRVRIPVPDIDGADADENRRDVPNFLVVAEPFGNNSEKKESIWRDWYWYKTKKDAMFETSRFLRRFCNL